MPRPNLTFPTGLVLQAIALGVRHGFDLMEATGLPSGTVYPALRRLEGAGCLRSEWEEEEVAEARARPPRCFYTLTAAGQTLLRQTVERFPAIPLAVDVGGTPDASRGRSGQRESGGPAPEPGRA